MKCNVAIGRTYHPSILETHVKSEPLEAEDRRLRCIGVTKLVATGYDQIADSYVTQFDHSALRARKLNELAHLLPSCANVLDIGCGAGVPVARHLIARGFKVTGVDASARQMERARCNAPQAHFIRADMTTIEFLAFAFDAVAAFYFNNAYPRVTGTLRF
jgi:SAM-dependent methyltransferase